MKTLAEQFEAGETVKIDGFTYRKGINENSFYDKFNKSEIDSTKDDLVLKWGRFKGGDFNNNPVASATLEELSSSEMDGNEEKIKELTCRMIDEWVGKIWCWWDNAYITKDQAKEYVLNYRTEP